MKNLKYKLIIPSALSILALSYSCKKFLDREPTGSLNTTVLASKGGVDGLLIGAYSQLDGFSADIGGDPWPQGVSNWIYGGVAADDAHKGSNAGDQPDAAAIENRSYNPANSYFNAKWRILYAGIARANDVLKELPLVTDGTISADYARQVTAEARFLRGVYHLEALKLWRNIPYVDETVSYDANNYNIANTTSALPKIEADFQAAFSVLPATQTQIGRANKFAAEAFLAKAYMFDHKYPEAKAALADLIANGVTSAGAKYALGPYANNFNPSTKNGPEAVFSVQMSVKDNAGGANGNVGDALNFPSGGPATCCGFYQPSFSFVNSFKVDDNGLPLFDTYNSSDLKNDQGLASTVAFTPSTEAVDARLDWSVGRRGIPYLDWGLHPGANWARDQPNGGPYNPIKNVYYKAAQATTSDTYSGWAPNQATANNYNMIRFADVLLWAAECEVEIGSLAQAQVYVNLVRARAANPTGWVHTYVDNADPSKGYTNTPAANYRVGLYTNQFVANGKEYARRAVYFERRLELGMEGHRFFDLQRWDARTGGPAGANYMANTLTAYTAHENAVPNFPNPTIKGSIFTAGKHELYAIPQAQIDLSNGALKQNPGH
ncbi:MAG: RagB/SusD family nutrient uptake outer membrane protein [Sphingobacteriaceae bacterium]|nr:MAG: RagB/SusD family nutrient uptake outer membrane protein [Sphingobacteriaceae bacterium]